MNWLRERLPRCLLMVAGLLVLTDAAPAQENAPPIPLPRAHAHNDYRHTRPLLDALAHCCSVAISPS